MLSSETPRFTASEGPLWGFPRTLQSFLVGKAWGVWETPDEENLSFRSSYLLGFSHKDEVKS